MTTQIDYDALGEYICASPEVLFDDLGLDWEIKNDKVNSSCPIHNSDNSHSFYMNLCDTPGRWSCFTGHCQKVFHSSLIGFVRGVLSTRHTNWQKPGDVKYSFLGYLTVY